MAMGRGDSQGMVAWCMDDYSGSVLVSLELGQGCCPGCEKAGLLESKEASVELQGRSMAVTIMENTLSVT